MKNIFLMILFFALPAAAQETRIESNRDFAYRMSQAVAIGGTYLDWQSSAPSPGSREKNVYISNNRAAQAALMAGTTALVMALAHNAKKDHHNKWPVYINLVIGGIHGGVAVWNYTR